MSDNAIMNILRVALIVGTVFFSIGGLGYALYQIEPAPPAGAMPITEEERLACEGVYVIFYNHRGVELVHPKPRIYKVAENRYVYHFYGWFNMLTIRETVTVPPGQTWNETRLNGKPFTCEGGASIWD